MNNKNECKTMREYDDHGNIIHYKDSNGCEEWRKYDDHGNLIHYKDSNGCEKWWKYDEDDNMIYLQTSNGYEEWHNKDEKENNNEYDKQIIKNEKEKIKMKKNVVNATALLVTLANAVFEHNRYWDGEPDSIIEEYGHLIDLMKQYNFDIKSLTKDELEMFGFQKWDETGLVLIPSYLYPIIPENMKLIKLDPATGNKTEFVFEDGEYEPEIIADSTCLSIGFIPTVTEEDFEEYHALQFHEALAILTKKPGYVITNRIIDKYCIKINQPKNDSDCTESYFAMTNFTDYTAPCTFQSAQLLSTNWEAMPEETFKEKAKLRVEQEKKQQEEMMKMIQKINGNNSSACSNPNCTCDHDCGDECTCRNIDDEIDN